jgi:hypothetical protein
LELDEEFDFGDSLDGVVFKILDLCGSDNEEFSNFQSHPHRLENLLKALGKIQSVRDNLNKLFLHEGILDRDSVEKMLKDTQLEN